MTESLFETQCRESKRLQEAWKPKLGNVIYIPSKNPMFGLVFDTAIVVSEKRGAKPPTTEKIPYVHFIDFDDRTQPDCRRQNEVIWLPRQEDLQKLYYTLCSKKRVLPLCIGDVLNKIHLNIITNILLFDTDDMIYRLNIAWLLFVHKELWNQTWDFENKKWIEEKTKC